MAQAFLLPFAIRIGFRLAGVARTQAALRSWSMSAPRVLHTPPGIRTVIASTRRAQVIVQRNNGIGGTCLVRTLTLWAMLKRRSIDTDMRTGMRRSEGKLEGHAWLEYGGIPLNEAASVVGTYSAFPEPVSFDLWRA